MKQPPKNYIYSNGDIFRLVIPLMIELALKLIVGLIDSVMVSSVGEAAVSGVSLVDSVMQLLIYVFAALAAGGAIVAGQYLGADRPKEARRFQPWHHAGSRRSLPCGCFSIQRESCMLRSRCTTNLTGGSRAAF